MPPDLADEHERADHELSWRDGKLARLNYTERDDPGLA